MSQQEILSKKRVQLSSPFILFYNFLLRLMATLTPPLSSALTSILSALLPRGFAVGPSGFCEGRLGLWWVGCLLKPGSLLGRDDVDQRSSSLHQSELMTRDADSRPAQTSPPEEANVSTKTFHSASERNYIFKTPFCGD